MGTTQRTTALYGILSVNSLVAGVKTRRGRDVSHTRNAQKTTYGVQ
jgi:hypothetical protein